MPLVTFKYWQCGWNCCYLQLQVSMKDPSSCHTNSYKNYSCLLFLLYEWLDYMSTRVAVSMLNTSESIYLTTSLRLSFSQLDKMCVHPEGSPISSPIHSRYVHTWCTSSFHKISKFNFHFIGEQDKDTMNCILHFCFQKLNE